MSAERFCLEVSEDVLQILRDTVCIRKVDIETCLREATTRWQRALAAQDDEFAAMAESSISELQRKLLALGGAHHAVFSARRVSDARIARLAARRRSR